MTGSAKLSPVSQEELDNLLIQQALALDPSEFDRELEPGEKADDAIDFGDLSDGDLAEFEDYSIQNEKTRNPMRGDESGEESRQQKIDPFNYPDSNFSSSAAPPVHDRNKEVQTDDFEAEGPEGPEGNANDELDYLFNGSQSSSGSAEAETRRREPQAFPSAIAAEPCRELEPHKVESHAQGKGKKSVLDVGESAQAFKRSEDIPMAEPSRLIEIQRELFAMSGSVVPGYSKTPPKNPEENLSSLWPTFQRGTIPKFMQLLPPPSAQYIGEKLPDSLKPVKPTKIKLELADDQARSFRLPSPRTTASQEPADGTVITGRVSFNSTSAENVEREPYLGFDNKASELDNEPIGGVSWEDLDFATANWDSFDEKPPSPERMDIDDNENYDSLPSQDKKTNIRTDMLLSSFSDLPSLDESEQATRQIAEAVVLDLNDQQLRLSSKAPEAKGASVLGTMLERNDRGDTAKGLLQRYNISNDDDDERLKIANHERTRRTLQNLAVEHSTPAVRLQYPYYKSTLEKGEARSFHRPHMTFKSNEWIYFAKPRIIKKKDLKGQPQEIFKTTKDLSLADNSKLLLLEYSEQYPLILPNFGMGSRLINYYRRKHADDISRPNLDIGELAVLLLNDASPFFCFGDIEPGKIVSALSNNMYKAPVFKQEANSTDFLVIRNTTGMEGSTWCIRTIENLRSVGQQFLSVEIPNPQAHICATTWMTKRLRLVSYRQIKRNKKTTIAEIMKHFPNTVSAIQRQKVTRFLHYSSDLREWIMPPGQAVPDEGLIRSLIKPEDVCLQDAGQVGKQYLEDIGLSTMNAAENFQEYEDRKGMSTEEQLAPWNISRNFIEATKNKGTLELHGEGDPSGRGEAFSFLKTSRDKFKAVGESVEERLKANDKLKKKKNGHRYNVDHLKRSYERSMRQIWEAQEQSLSKTEQSEEEMDKDEEGEEGEGEGESGHGGEYERPSSRFQTPSTNNATTTRYRQDDETVTNFSAFTAASSSSSTAAGRSKVLRITRDIRDEFGNIQQKVELIEDPRVMRQYLKRRHAKEIEAKNVLDLAPTGDAEVDRYAQKRLEKELARLEKNKQSRHQREYQRTKKVQSTAVQQSSWPAGAGILAAAAANKPPHDGNGQDYLDSGRQQYLSSDHHHPSSSSSAAPAPAPSSVIMAAAAPPKIGGDIQQKNRRRCTACGQPGHYRSNKKLCAMYMDLS